jgi:translation initiation factor IF-3
LTPPPFRKPFKPKGPAHTLNENIRAFEVRLLDENGTNLGVVSREEAIAKAKEKGLDLVLVGENATPVIVKIVNYDKFRYEKEKEQKKQRVAQKANEMKQIQISMKEAKNDLQTKLKRLYTFFEDGHKVEIQLTMRGREKEKKDWARMKLEEFLKMIEVEYKITRPIQPGGRGLIVQISK